MERFLYLFRKMVRPEIKFFQTIHFAIHRFRERVPRIPFFLDGECREDAEDGAYGRIEPRYAAEVRDKDAGIICVARPDEVKNEGKKIRNGISFFMSAMMVDR